MPCQSRLLAHITVQLRPDACARLFYRLWWADRHAPVPNRLYRHCGRGCVLVYWSYTARMTWAVITILGVNSIPTGKRSAKGLEKSGVLCLPDRGRHRVPPHSGTDQRSSIRYGDLYRQWKWRHACPGRRMATSFSFVPYFLPL